MQSIMTKQLEKVQKLRKQQAPVALPKPAAIHPKESCILSGPTGRTLGLSGLG